MILDGEMIRENGHDYLMEALDFPDYYGKNLDALHDQLTTLTGTLRLENWEAAESSLGKYGIAARKAITAAGLENDQLDIII